MADLYKLPNEVKFDGMTLPGKFIQPKLVEQIKDFKTQPNDVLLTSFPRCGGTWNLETVYLIMTNGDFETAKSKNFMERSFFLELIPDAKSVDKNADGTMLKAQSEKSACGRILKTHTHFRHVKDQLVNQKVKTICILRNPKDMLVSLYRFYQDNLILGFFQGDWNEFFKLFQTKNLFYGDWFDWVSGYWENKHLDNILFVKYEDAKADIKAHIRRIAKFIEREISEDLVDKIADHVSFDKMKENPNVNEQVLKKLGFMKEGPHDGSQFIRKGVVGGWKEYLSDEQSKFVDENYGKPLEKKGMVFRYE